MTGAPDVIVVAGASRGIGEQIARRLGQAGNKVVLAARSREPLQAIADSLPAAAISCVDFTQLDALEAWLASVAREHGPLRGLVYCAGSVPSVLLKDADDALMEQTFRLNALAPMLLAKAFRRPGAFQAPASIVLISSVMGLVGQPLRTLYSASKAAMLGFVRSAALELARQGIRVNAVAPGVVETEQSRQFMELLADAQKSAIIGAHALGLGQPADVAAAVAFLLSEESRWITGTTLVVDGGYTAQ